MRKWIVFTALLLILIIIFFFIGQNESESNLVELKDEQAAYNFYLPDDTSTNFYDEQAAYNFYLPDDTSTNFYFDTKMKHLYAFLPDNNSPMQPNVFNSLQSDVDGISRENYFEEEIILELFNNSSLIENSEAYTTNLGKIGIGTPSHLLNIYMGSPEESILDSNEFSGWVTIQNEYLNGSTFEIIDNVVVGYHITTENSDSSRLPIELAYTSYDKIIENFRELIWISGDFGEGTLRARLDESDSYILFHFINGEIESYETWNDY